MVPIDFNTRKRTRAYRPKFYLTKLSAKIQISHKIKDQEEKVPNTNISIQTMCRVNHHRCLPHMRRLLFGIFSSLLFTIGSSNTKSYDVKDIT